MNGQRRVRFSDVMSAVSRGQTRLAYKLHREWMPCCPAWRAWEFVTVRINRRMRNSQ